MFEGMFEAVYDLVLVYDMVMVHYHGVFEPSNITKDALGRSKRMEHSWTYCIAVAHTLLSLSSTPVM